MITPVLQKRRLWPRAAQLEGSRVGDPSSPAPEPLPLKTRLGFLNVWSPPSSGSTCSLIDMQVLDSLNQELCSRGRGGGEGSNLGFNRPSDALDPRCSARWGAE